MPCGLSKIVYYGTKGKTKKVLPKIRNMEGIQVLTFMYRYLGWVTVVDKALPIDPIQHNMLLKGLIHLNHALKVAREYKKEQKMKSQRKRDKLLGWQHVW